MCYLHVAAEHGPVGGGEVEPEAAVAEPLQALRAAAPARARHIKKETDLFRGSET